MPLCRRYPVLYGLCTQQDCSVAEVLDRGWVVQFKIQLPHIIRDMWYELAAHLNSIRLGEGKDRLLWNWTTSKKFFVKSTYNHITRRDRGDAYKAIWKAKIPEKVKIFMWLVFHKSILTEENMIKRNWGGDSGCYFCNDPKIVDHLWFSCPVAKVIWGIIALCFH
jgi:hypothetical protein